MKDTAYLLINLGTPSAPHAPEVGVHLKEFLMDPAVIDIPAPLRWFLVNVLIVPKRSHRSAEAYQSIWTERGSPLMFHGEDLLHTVQRMLPDSSLVQLGMRYGKPSIESALEKLLSKNPLSIRVIPLYPQYSLAATESSIVKVKEILKKKAFSGSLEILRHFYEEPMFIECFAEKIRTRRKPDEHVLFSYHGLPERHVKKTDLSVQGNYCLSSADCCAQINEANRDCYRAQSFATTRALVKSLNLKEGEYSVGFQSRLGRTPWIQPFTDHLYESLAKKGVKKLCVVCPSFTADCLETLEEIEQRGAEDFKKFGGDSLQLIPSLNSDPAWARTLQRYFTDSAFDSLFTKMNF